MVFLHLPEQEAPNLMKTLNDSLLVARNDQLKRRSFLRSAPAATAFLLATVASAPAETTPPPAAPLDEGGDGLGGGGAP